MRPFALFILLFSCGLNHTSAQDTLLLFHPTANNMEVIEKLVLEKLFDLDGYHVLGVFHNGETYDYDQARRWLNENPEDPFTLREIGNTLEPGNLFGTNECSEDFKALFMGSRGALFMGGPDIPPWAYNESVHLLTRVTDPYRHYLEISYLFHLLGGLQDAGWVPYLEKDTDYLVGGICLGMQSMNVATGGTMIQDIPTEIYGLWNAEEILALPPDQMHRNYADKVNTGCEEPTSYHFHRVRLKEGSFLKKELKFRSKSDPLVLSSHHQSVESPGMGWVVAATSMDGKIIEAMEHEQYPNVVGVQFHPEKPGLFDPSIIHPNSCNSRINFQQVIRDTDSYKFHKAYWKFMGSTLQKIKKPSRK